jgi:hypothetical protein
VRLDGGGHSALEELTPPRRRRAARTSPPSPNFYGIAAETLRRILVVRASCGATKAMPTP